VRDAFEALFELFVAVAIGAPEDLGGIARALYTHERFRSM
jgi:hypothetical protein